VGGLTLKERAAVSVVVQPDHPPDVSALCPS